MNNMICGNCEYIRRLRYNEEFLDGFCKCTGWDINIHNERIEAPDWCPLLKKEKSDNELS